MYGHMETGEAGYIITCYIPDGDTPRSKTVTARIRKTVCLCPIMDSWIFGSNRIPVREPENEPLTTRHGVKKG